MDTREPFSQLQLRFTDPIQYDYEAIRPVVLFADTIAQRSRETDMPRSTMNEKARRFVTGGMLGLVDRRTQVDKSDASPYPEPVANYILYLKQLYPPIHYREIVRIIARKYGHKTTHPTVKRFLDRYPIPVQMELELKPFHQFEDAYQARWTVVRLFHEGWNKRSIAGLLKLSHQHVGRIIDAFAKDGFTALEDKRTRPANHPHNQLTLPFMEEVFAVQQEYPRAGRFRVHGILEQQQEEDIASERTVGRAMAYNRVLRGAPPAYPPPEEESDEVKSFPFRPYYRHHYWFIDIRYLVQLDGQWVYSICVIEGYSRKILAGLATRYQDELAVLQLLHAALSEYGLPWGLVSDNGSVFTANVYEDLLFRLEIEPCHIEKRKAWQNLIESQFRIQSRLADAKFEEATSLEEIQEQHAAFIQLFNTTNHWAHRDRFDGCTTPVAVLGWQKGRKVDLSQLRNAFRQLQFPRTINRHGSVSVQRFYIYAERGLAKRRVAVWIYEDRLHIEYRQQMLAGYACRLDRRSHTLKSVTKPNLYRSLHADPQIELFELDDEQWLKILRRPPYAPRKTAQEPVARQLSWLTLLILCLATRS